MRNTILLLATLAVGFSTQSCTEEIDTSSRYTFKEETVGSYLEKHEQYSEYVKLLYTVKISRRSESTVGQLMTARGNFTCFAPTNDAIQEYLDSLVSQGLIKEAKWEAFTDEHKLDSIQKVIVYNSIIDGGDDIMAYETGSFPTDDGAEFDLPNLFDRKLNTKYDKEENIYYISGAPMDERNQNIHATNGVVHAMNGVINPSNDAVAQWYRNILDKKIEGYYVMAQMVQACGLLDTLDKVRDEVYEELYQTAGIQENFVCANGAYGENGTFYTPKHRLYGYTIFAETDHFWQNEIGKPYDEITLEDVRKYLVDNGVYPDAVDDTNYKSEDNLLNQFITYHILPERLTTDRLIYHYNEKGYNLQTNTYAVPMSEFYTTMGKRRLLKIYQAGKTYSLNQSTAAYLNRFPKLDNGMKGTYKEISCTPQNEGIEIGTPNLEGDNNVVNAMVYPIESLLTYSDNTRNEMQKGRIRFDFTAMWPEFINNDIRANVNGDEKHTNIYIPSDNTYKYLSEAWCSDNTVFLYWTGRNKGWQNWQGDELTVRGNQDVTFRLPPVPRKGTYELRYAIQCGGVYRTMAQIYFGEDREHMRAQGIPMDLRQGAYYRYTKQGNFISDTGYQSDNGLEEDAIREVDKKMRNKDFMKGCNQSCAGGPGAGTMMRGSDICLRRIIVRQDMDPDKDYYIRFKSVLDDKATYLYGDYLEFCAKEVYDNPAEPEDIW